MNKLTLGVFVAVILVGTGAGLTFKASTTSAPFTVTKAQYNGHTHKLLLKTKSVRAQNLKVTYKGKTIAQSSRAAKHHHFKVKFHGYGTFKVTNGHLTKKVTAKRYATTKPVLQSAKTPAGQQNWQPTVKVPAHSKVVLKFRGKVYHADAQAKHQVTFKVPVRTRSSDQAFRQEQVTLTAKQPHKKTSKLLQRKIGLDFPT